MRALLYRTVLLLALLFVGTAGQRLSAPAPRQGLSPLQPSQRQAVIARGSLQTLALAVSGRQTRRGYGPPTAAWVLPAQVRPSFLIPQHIEFQRITAAPPEALAFGVHGPRAPPADAAFA